MQIVGRPLLFASDRDNVPPGVIKDELNTGPISLRNEVAGFHLLHLAVGRELPSDLERLG